MVQPIISVTLTSRDDWGYQMWWSGTLADLVQVKDSILEAGRGESRCVTNLGCSLAARTCKVEAHW